MPPLLLRRVLKIIAQIENTVTVTYHAFLVSNYSRSSRKRPPREVRKVVATRAGRLQEWALVSDHMMKQ